MSKVTCVGRWNAETRSVEFETPVDLPPGTHTVEIVVADMPEEDRQKITDEVGGSWSADVEVVG